MQYKAMQGTSSDGFEPVYTPEQGFKSTEPRKETSGCQSRGTLKDVGCSVRLTSDDVETQSHRRLARALYPSAQCEQHFIRFWINVMKNVHSSHKQCFQNYSEVGEN